MNMVMKYAEQNGYSVAGLPHECYIDGIWNKESEEDWLTEIQLPIEYTNSDDNSSGKNSPE